MGGLTLSMTYWCSVLMKWSNFCWKRRRCLFRELSMPLICNKQPHDDWMKDVVSRAGYRPPFLTEPLVCNIDRSIL